MQSSLSIREGLVPGPQRIRKSTDAQVPQIKSCSVLNSPYRGFRIFRFRCKAHRYGGWLHVCICIFIHTHTSYLSVNLGEPWTFDWFHFLLMIIGSLGSPHCLGNQKAWWILDILCQSEWFTGYLASSASWDMILFFPDSYQAYGPILTLPRFPYVLLAFFSWVPQQYSNCASMGSWHGFQEACLGLDMLPYLLSMYGFQMPIFSSTPTSAGGKSHHRGRVNTSTSVAFLYLISVPIGSSISEICWSVDYLFWRLYFRNSRESY